jgi:perosamine synthetase
MRPLPLISHNRPTLGLEEARAAERVLKSGWLAQGREVEAFENELCEQLGLAEGHAVALSSGTAALFIALRVVGAEGEIVACPVYACSALAHAIKFAGSEPQFVDVVADTANPAVVALNRTAAPIAIVAHMFGQPVDLVDLKKRAVIEDCAQALGARVHGHPVGLGGTVAIFSFYATKIITSGGQGGMLVSRDRGLVDMARDYREYDGRHDRKPRFNFQMTDLQAAIGREQLKKLPSFIKRRAEIFELYKSAGFNLVDTAVDGEPVRYRTVLRTQSTRSVIEALARNGITAIVPVEDWELLAAPAEFPHAARFTQNTVSLPTYPFLRNEEVLRVVGVVANCLSLGSAGE